LGILSHINLLNANVEYTRHDADVTCSSCSASYRRLVQAKSLKTAFFLKCCSKRGKTTWSINRRCPHFRVSVIWRVNFTEL